MVGDGHFDAALLQQQQLPTLPGHPTVTRKSGLTCDKRSMAAGVMA